MKRLETLLEWGGTRKEIILLVLGGLALLASILGWRPFPFDMAWIAIVLCGIPIVLEAIIGLVTAFDIKADVLVSIALVASVITGEDFAAGEVAFIMQLGALLEDLTVARARAGIEKLVHLTPQTARRLKDGREEVIAAEQVRIGDVLRVNPGETVPVDGVIVSGQTSINQAVMTGESLPVDKQTGDEVSSGTVNQFGAFDMRATRVGEDSSIQRMIRLLQSADAGKAVVHCYRTKTHMEPQPATQFQMLPGRGVAAIVEERQVLAGILALSDTIREDAADMVAQVKQAGVTPVLLTGDHENAAGQIADQIQIDEVRANCLPEQKLKWIDQYQAAGSRVCMIGDGINDAPALKQAYVGIAMGGIGSDIAVDAADIALVDDEIRELPHLLRLARRMMITIKCNLAFSMTLNFIAIILAMNGVLNPVVGALVHNAGSVLVILNSALLLKWRKRK